MADLSIHLLWGSALAVCVVAQNHTGNTLDRPMGQSRMEMARLLDKLYSHRAIQHRLSPAPQVNTVNISVDVIIKKVSDIDELTQVVDSFVHFVVTWHDPDLIWEPQEYGGLQVVNLDKDKLWYPILQVINAGDSESLIVGADQVTSLWYNGTALYHTTKFLKSTCTLDLSEYPSDVQQCDIDVVPSVITPEAWIEQGRIREMEKGQFEEKGAWKIVNTSVEVGAASRYSFIKVHMQLQRQALFYTMCLLLPMFTTSLLTVFVFCIPPNAGDKMSFLVSIVLADTVMLNLLGGIIPRSLDKMPRFLMFVIGVIIENILAFVCTLIVIGKHEHEQNKEASCRCHASSLPGTRVSFDEPCTDPRIITSRNVNYSTGKSFQRNIRKSSNTVSPELTKAAAIIYNAQSLARSDFPHLSKKCVPCRSRLEDWLRKPICIRACTLDKMCFFVFLSVHLSFTTVIMCL